MGGSGRHTVWLEHRALAGWWEAPAFHVGKLKEVEDELRRMLSPPLNIHGVYTPVA